MKNSTKIIIVILFAFILIGIYFFINSRIKVYYEPVYNIDDFYTIPSRKLSVNEYKIVEINDEEAARKYFNIFISEVFNSRDKSYNLLDDDYKENRFPTYGMYLSYLNTVTNDFSLLPKISSYSKDISGNYTIYTVLDQNNYKYVFIVEAVMKYKVKFDE